MGQDRTEPSGTPARISLGVDISPSTETLNLRFERKELMSLTKPVENFSLENLYISQSVMWYQKPSACPRTPRP
jgi:hypothetical protein